MKIAILLPLVLALGACKSDPHVGAICSSNADCPAGPCLPVGRCTASCDHDSDCIPGWSCGVFQGTTDKYCQCTRQAEICDGKDNDCDTQIDNNATCGVDEVCKAGACACTATACGSACVQLGSNFDNCGACGNACVENESCVSGACDCPLTKCGTVCQDTTSDPFNCGPCGHNCLGGACSNSECQSTVVASANAQISALLVQEPYVFYLSKTLLQRVSVGSTAAVTIASGFSGGTFFALDPTGAYVYDQSSFGILRVLSSAVSTTGVAVVTGATNVTGLQVGGGHLYWAPSDHTIRRSALDGTTPETVVTGITGTASGLTLDASNLYWYDGKAIYSGPLAPPSVATGTLLATAAGTIGNMVLYNGYLYFSQALAGTQIASVPVAGGTPMVLISGTQVFGMGVDTSGVYWSSATGLEQADRGGVSRSVLLTTGEQLYAFAFDPMAVYYAGVNSFGEVHRLAK